MFKKLKKYLVPDASDNDTQTLTREQRIHIATCVLLLEMAHVDDTFSIDEQTTIREILQTDLNIPGETIDEIIEFAMNDRQQTVDLYDYTRFINNSFTREDKRSLIEYLWKVIYADGVVDQYESYLVHKLQELLHLEHEDLIAAKIKMRPAETGKSDIESLPEKKQVEQLSSTTDTQVALSTFKNVAVWSGGSSDSRFDLWLLGGFSESHLCFRDAFKYPVSEDARLFIFDPPGQGASPPRTNGLTIPEYAALWKELIDHYSGSRPVVLAGHSMASIVAVETVALMENKPLMVVSVEGNLIKADAFFTGQAANYDTPEEFYAFFTKEILKRVGKGRVPMRYFSSLQFADPLTIWTLGRSVLEYRTPGQDLMDLACPYICYWDSKSVPPESKEFILNNNVRNRELDGMGHWPMVHSPETFYKALRVDLRQI